MKDVTIEKGRLRDFRDVPPTPGMLAWAARRFMAYLLPPLIRYRYGALPER